MKLSRFLVLSTFLIAFPAAAQDRSTDISVFATWVDPSGTSTLRDGDEFETEFDANLGWGLAVNLFWSNRISTEFAASIVEPDLIITERPRAVRLVTPLEMMPISAVLQYHFAPTGSLDFYLGLGGAYVLFDDIQDAGDIDLDEIDFEDDVGLVANAGLGWAFTPSFGLYLDAKYVPLEAAATAVVAGGGGEEQEIKVDPLMLSAGITFRF